jgi:hypothetical protein
VYYPIIGAHHFALIFAGVMSCLIGSTHGVLEAFRSLREVRCLTNFTEGDSPLTMHANGELISAEFQAILNDNSRNEAAP